MGGNASKEKGTLDQQRAYLKNIKNIQGRKKKKTSQEKEKRQETPRIIAVIMKPPIC